MNMNKTVTEDTLMKLKKTISLLLVFVLLGAFACCFSAAGSEIVIGKAYISFSDNGIRTETDVNYPDPIGTIYGQSEVTLHAGDSVEDITRAFVETIKLAQIEIGVKDGKNYLKALKNVITESGTEIASFGAGALTRFAFTWPNRRTVQRPGVARHCRARSCASAPVKSTFFEPSTHERESCTGGRSLRSDRSTRADFASQSVCRAAVKNCGSPHFTTG